MTSSSTILRSEQLQAQLTKHDIRPYVAEESGRSLHSCVAEVNQNNFNGYGADYRQGAGAEKIVVGCLQQYRDLIQSLAAMPHVCFVPHCELNTHPVPSDKLFCSIRHDVDADPRVSLAEAEIEAEFDARTTYFILHSSPYYGVFEKGVFYRHSCMALLYRQIQELGQEIALHTDPLWLYQQLKIDGAQAVVEEIEWLRSQGLRIVGTVAHNSAPIYGIENYAIFRGRNRHNIGFGTTPDQGSELINEIVHEGRWAPLGIIDESALGLTYEGNEFFRQQDVPLEYGATRAVNRWRWNLHLKRLKEHPDPREDQFIDQPRLLRDIESMPGGRWLILNVHPLYYGARHNTTTAPPMQVESISVDTYSPIGWECYCPNTLQAYPGNDQDAQVINFSDETGMLDAPCPSADDVHGLRILFLGGANLDGFATPIPEHCGQQLSRLLNRHLDRSVWCRTLAFPSMGLCRHFDWFTRYHEIVKPHIVVIGVGADELLTSIAPYWCLLTGFDQTYPPASYLKSNGAGVEVVKGSPARAAIRRRQAQVTSQKSSLTVEHGNQHKDELNQICQCLQFYADAIRRTGSHPLLLVNECGESAGMWSRDISTTTRRDGHMRALHHIRQWATEADMPLIDPYESFLDSEEDLPCHIASGQQWNATGHRLAARSLFDAVVAHASDGTGTTQPS